MKFIIILAALINTAFAQNPRDSIGVFHRPEQVIVLANEYAPARRINAFMNALGTNELIITSNRDSSFKLHCYRTAEAASCKFVLRPSDSVQIAVKRVSAVTSELQIDSESEFEMSFASSNGDRLKVTLNHGRLYLTAAKR